MSSPDSVMRLSLLKAATALLALSLSIGPSPFTAPALAAGVDCMSELDRHVADARAGQLERAERELQALLEECNQLPQLRHDLGSLAARRGDWDAAIEHLEAAIALDERTADTVGALRDIQRWRAANAYAEALGEPKPAVPPPTPSLHDSRRRNAESQRRDATLPADAAPTDTSLHDQSLLELALASWWNSATEGRADAHNAHYAADFAGETLASFRSGEPLPPWEAVVRHIALGRQDAVVLVRWGTPAGSRHERLMLLHPDEGRWTIYQERVL